MKKVFALLLVFTLLSVSLSVIAESTSIISIDLTNATDEELEQARLAIVQEQKSRIVTKIILNEKEINLNKGGNAKITATVEDLLDNVTAGKLVWSSSDNNVATVKNGAIHAAGAGTALITCSCELSDGVEISETCNVNVSVPITSVSFTTKKANANIGDVFNQAALIMPKDATNTELLFESSNTDIATIEGGSGVKIIAAGTVTITATAQDGSNKSASYTLTIPSLKAPESFTVTDKTGDTFSVDYYGVTPNDVTIVCKNTRIAKIESGYETSKKDGNYFWIYVEPVAAGKTQVVISDGKDKVNQRTVNITIDDNAVYSAKSYPKIRYEDAFRYPDKYEDQNVSFTGRVLQVVSSTKFRISSKGRYNDVVYVTASSSAISTPILEGDTVTVYGTYNGTYTYKTVLGKSTTIPEVYAEKIVVK